jgi:hypothetical protein
LQPQDGVFEPVAAVGPVEDLDEVAVRLHGPGVDANQHVPRAHTRPGGRRVFGHDAGGQAFALGTPEHAVLELRTTSPAPR